MRYTIRHETTYQYSDTAQLSHNIAHLEPLATRRQLLHSFRIEATPAASVISRRKDGWGNALHFLLVQDSHREFRLLAESDVEVLPVLDPPVADSSPWEAVAASMRPRPIGDLAWISQFRHASPFVPILDAAKELALEVFTPDRPVLEAASELMHRIHDGFEYDPSATSVSTPLADLFRLRRGVCQDFAHVFLGCLRSLGLPARYVSGYLETLPPPGKARLIGADASHAWIQVWCPEQGWLDLDPTNDLVPGERHVAVATGRDFGDVTPLKGLILGGGVHVVQVSVDVAPRVEEAV